MKEIIKILKMQIPAGKATAAPPLGPLLSQCGVNPSLFVRAFNEKTINDNKLYSVKIFIFTDKTFEFLLLTTPISKLILQKINLQKGSSNSKNIIHKLTQEEVDEIIKEKKKDFPKLSFNSLKNMVLGTAQNMGIISQ